MQNLAPGSVVRTHQSALIILAATIGLVSTVAAVLAPQYARAPIASRPLSIGGPTAPGAARAVGSGSRHVEAPKQSASVDTRVKLRLGPWLLDRYAIAWFLAVIVLQLRSRSASAELNRRLGLYLFVVSVLGLSGVFWSLHQVSYHPRLIAKEYFPAIGSVVVVFALSTIGDLASVRACLPYGHRDAFGIIWRFETLLAGVVLAAIAWVSAMPGAATGAVPAGKAFEPWFASQPRVDLGRMPTASPGKVVVFKFNDYQCPPCKRGEESYRPLVERLNLQSHNAIEVQSLDFPLETECNPGVPRDIHPAACEAAAAVRAARAEGREREMAEWLWSNQKALTRARVFAAAREIAGVKLEEVYDTILEEVRADVERGRLLGVTGTPTYFINGVKLPLVSSGDFELALLHELRGGPSAVGSSPRR